MSGTNRLLSRLPLPVQSQLEAWGDAVSTLSEVRNPRVAANLLPSAFRGLFARRGKQGRPTRFPATHDAFFDWKYPGDDPEMGELYRRAKRGQWDGEVDLDWSLSVDPENPATPLLPRNFFAFDVLAEAGIRLTTQEQDALVRDVACWMLSQFLHGEQGALMAACQVTEAVERFDGKFYGATQVVDEARHVEVFHRYLDDKLGKLYQINDNLFVIIDALMTDSRWDMKFLGMQIMVEGLALGAFGTMYRLTGEPLLRDLLGRVIQDEARHVHYGVLALREHIRHGLDESARREREDWALEVALLMRDRFLAMEVYDEWFGPRLGRATWKRFVYASHGMEEFRHTMFRRLVPNLREIGLLTDRIRPRYEAVGLARYFGEAAAPDITGDGMLAELDAAA